MSGTILRHPAKVRRCWTLQQNEVGQWLGVLTTRDGVELCRTQEGSLYLVRDAIKHQRMHCGLPIRPLKGRRDER